MVRLITYLSVSIVLFLGGAGLSWLKLKQDDAGTQQTTPESEPLVAKVPANLDAPDTPEGTTDPLPVPVRGEPMTAEEIFRYGASIRGQYESLMHRQEEVDKEEARLKLMYEDIRGTREELDGIQARVNDAVTMAERLLAEVQAERAVMDAQTNPQQSMLPAEADQSASDAAMDDMANIKKISQWVQEMEPAVAAQYLKQLSNDGKLESATRVLGNIEDRNVAEILSEIMDDPDLVVQLTESYRSTKRPTKNTTQRR